jgi:hypothetical protein
MRRTRVERKVESVNAFGRVTTTGTELRRRVERLGDPRGWRRLVTQLYAAAAPIT